MPQVAISSDFLTAFSRVPKGQQKKVREFITRFQTNPTSAGINYEAIQEARDKRVRSVRIDLAYRAIVLHPQQGDVFLLAWVDHHDEAMEWARNKIFEVNPATGALQIIDAKAVEQVVSLPPAGPKTLEEYGPFETFGDDDLLRAGLPRPLLPAVRALKSAEALEDLKPFLPDEAYETLFWVANLGYSVDQALGQVAKPPAKIDTEDLAAALEHPDSRRRFVVVKSADELVEMLNAPLEKWRVFLHPSQASLVRRDFKGAARVLGGAGTGKTVVAMHRAHYLAAEVFTQSTDRILFTTFTRNLATNIRGNLKSLCGTEFDRIEVTHLHSWAASFLKSQGINISIASRAELDACWQNAFSAVGTGAWPEGFFHSEWERVVQAQGITTKEEYLQAPRTGQSVRLARPQRAQVWQVLDEFKRGLTASGKLEWTDLIRQTRLYLAHSGVALPYRAVVVDETQDWHPEDLKLIRQLVPSGANDLFLVGDAHQRIYGRPVVLSQCGINVRGRSSKLRINYRTTEEIRDWSVGVLTNQAVDDLDGGADALTEYTSLLHGQSPQVLRCKSLSEEQACLIERIKALLQDVAPETICLVARTNRQLLEDYAPMLARAGLACLHLQRDTPEDAGPGVRLATMHRVKGLEFAHVLIAGVNDGVVPLEAALHADDQIERADSELQERCLFHVAATRARDTLSVTSYGVPSRWLPVAQAD
jgi:superfamily I DNA/RNA helicase